MSEPNEGLGAGALSGRTRTGLTPTEMLADELQRLLETVSYVSCRRFGGVGLIVDRRSKDGRIDIRADLGDHVETDLWGLDPLLWDEAYWAASRAVRPGEVRTFFPFLHRG